MGNCWDSLASDMASPDNKSLADLAAGDFLRLYGVI